MRAAQRAADGLLRVRHARPRGPAEGDGDARPRRQPLGEECTVDSEGRIRVSASTTCSAPGAPRSRALVAAREAGGSSAHSRPRLACGGRPAILDGSPGRAPAIRWRASRRSPADRPVQLGVAAPATRATPGTQLALPLGAGRAAAAPRWPTGSDGRRLRDDRPHSRPPPGGAAAGGPAGRRGDHARPRGDAPRAPGAARRPVVARQRPGTAKGIVFLLLEDEFGTINLDRPAGLYDQHRLVVREPRQLAFAAERLSGRSGGASRRRPAGR